jgi:hypothetical protein
MMVTHGNAMSDEDSSLLRQACASADEAADWLGRRLGTYDEQYGEADAQRRAADAAHALKLRLAAHVLDCAAREGG